jgi:membrane carboxypeptidase/penicillin-binding protein PbpC
MGLRGHNINNAASAVMDYRTGEVLAYVGSASYTSKGNKKFQPQFDVLSDGWRQPGVGDQADRLQHRASTTRRSLRRR